MKFKFPKDSFDIARKQVTQIEKDSDFYETMSESEYKTIATRIKQPKKILELGCGLGRMSVFLNWMLRDDKAQYILADSTPDRIPEKVRYGWDPDSGFYNDLAETFDFCRLNGLNNFETFDLKEHKLEKLSNIDLVMSFLSVGFHYPIEMYMDTLYEITSPSCMMVFGVRRGKYNIESFKHMFSDVDIIEQPGIDTREDILIMENKI